MAWVFIAPLGLTGQLDIYNANDDLQVIADLTGWFAEPPI